MENSTQTAPPSKLARISLIFAAIGWLVWCLFLLVTMVFLGGAEQLGNTTDVETMGYAVFLGGPLITSIFTIIFTLVGLVTGIMALRKKDAQRGMAIAGLLMSLACIVPYFLFFILLGISAITSN
jgi:hypothetical protein